MLNQLKKTTHNNITNCNTLRQRSGDRPRDFTDYLGAAKTLGCYVNVRNLTHVADGAPSVMLLSEHCCTCLIAGDSHGTRPSTVKY